MSSTASRTPERRPTRSTAEQEYYLSAQRSPAYERVVLAEY